MKLLDINRYDEVKAPLANITINSFFARMVVERKITGSIFVSGNGLYKTFYIVHPYGMSLLIGDTGNEAPENWLLDYMLNSTGKRSRVEWLQTYPRIWDAKIEALLGNKLVKTQETAGELQDARIEQHTRVNFKFNPGKFNLFMQTLTAFSYPIVRTNAALYGRMKGSVVPQSFWDSADDFITMGIGFSVVVDDEPVSTAYSAYIFDGILELGIETSPAYRGKGLAQWACVELITYCMENHYEPVWSCRLENTGSYLLAQKLGFEPVLTLPYYRLPV